MHNKSSDTLQDNNMYNNMMQVSACIPFSEMRKAMKNKLWEQWLEKMDTKVKKYRHFGKSLL